MKSFKNILKQDRNTKLLAQYSKSLFYNRITKMRIQPCVQQCWLHDIFFFCAYYYDDNKRALPVWPATDLFVVEM